MSEELPLNRPIFVRSKYMHQVSTDVSIQQLEERFKKRDEDILKLKESFNDLKEKINREESRVFTMSIFLVAFATIELLCDFFSKKT